MVPAMVKPGPDDGHTLNEFLQSLVATELGETAVLTCYLDARIGMQSCLDFVARSAARVRRNLGGAARFDFDAAVAAIEKAIRLDWDAQVQGLALFARGPVGGPMRRVVRLAVPVDNTMTLYRLPDIAPLLLLREREARFTLLLALEHGIEVLDCDTGLTAPRAWIGRRAGVGDAEPGIDPGGSRRRRVLILDKAVRTLRPALMRGPVLPLLMAAQGLHQAEPHWHPRIELAHRACRQGVPVVAAESAQLCAVGGIACLLRPGPRRGSVALPVRARELGLVA